jgi:uncharacterized SAM-binding protein YcdF (DUF218 family)
LDDYSSAAAADQGRSALWCIAAACTRFRPELARGTGVSLSNIAVALVIPPFSLLPVCVAGLLMAWRYRRLGVLIMVAGLTGLGLLALPLVSGGLIASLERNLPLTPPAGDPPQAIVILGGDTVQSHGKLDVGALTLERERAGAALQRRVGLPILVTGGLAGRTGETIAGAMAKSLAADFNTPARWIEPAATDTWDNAAFSAAILQAQGIHSIYLVTHAWHMRRALIAFARTGIRVTAAPVEIDSMPEGVESDFVPRTKSWLTSYYAFHEWIGCAAYTLLR